MSAVAFSRSGFESMSKAALAGLGSGGLETVVSLSGPEFRGTGIMAETSHRPGAWELDRAVLSGVDAVVASLGSGVRHDRGEDQFWGEGGASGWPHAQQFPSPQSAGTWPSPPLLKRRQFLWDWQPFEF